MYHSPAIQYKNQLLTIAHKFSFQDLELDNLDAAAAAIAEAQESSLNERKKLAEETKKWNKLDKEEKFTSMISLLRTYQKEVDRLTTRAKQGEQAFLDVFQVLSKVPSVEEAKELARELISLAGSAASLEGQNRKLLHEIEGYKADFTELTSQDVTVRKQEELIAQYQQEIARLSSEGAIDAEKKVESRFNDELERKDLVIAQLRSELRHANETVTAAMHERDIAQTQIHNLEARHGREMKAKQSEVDMLSSEVETLTHTVTEQRTLLSQQANQSSSLSSQQNETNNPSDVVHHFSSGVPQERSTASSGVEFDVEKDIQLTHLMQELHDATLKIETQKESHARETAEMEAKLHSMNSTLSQLPTPQEWKQVQTRMSVLQELENYLGVGDMDMNQGVDVILRDKLRKLERANLDYKAQIKSLEEQKAEHVTKLDHLKLILSERESQIANMEDTIATHSSSSSGGSGNASDPSTHSNNDADHAESMIQVMKSQRDRLKQRVAALEAEKDRLAEQARLANVKAQTLQEDNVKLYQKMRYIQSFNAGSSGGAINSMSSGSVSSKSLSSQSHDLEQGAPTTASASSVEDKYKTIYEDTVNPFAAFNDREKSKRIGELNAAERIIYSTTSFFLATRNTRMVLFAYLVIVHLFVVYISYRSAVSTTACNQRSDT